MPGPTESQSRATFQDQLLTEDLRNRLLQIAERVHSECEKLRQALKAQGWPPKEVEARVSEFESELAKRDEDWLLKALSQEKRV